MGVLDVLRIRKSTTTRQRSGDAAENSALAYLCEQGLTLVERNFTCKSGEIDLIMQCAVSLVFVEVRSRSGAAFGNAATSISRVKQTRLLRAAQIYLQRYRHPPACRFDVVAIDGAVITWLQNAIDS